MVVGLRRRATRLRRASYVTLGLIVLSVLLGFRAFAYAGYITQREERYQEFEFTRNLDSLSSELSSLIREAIKEGRVAEVSNQLEELKQTITDQAKTVRESRQMPSGMSVWSTISTRITSVLLLLFLVQILVTMYRYNTRLAAFYDARADILQLSPPQDAVAFTEVVTAFSADSLDFGRAPKTPAQAAVELAKELIKGGAVTRTQKVV